MPEKRIEKPAEEEGKKLPLVTNEKFAKFLVKEFPEEFERQPGKAKETAFRYPQDKKEVVVLLKEWMPKASFKSISHILSYVSHDAISQRLRILEEHEISPSTWFLPESTAKLERGIKTLEENGIMKSIKDSKKGVLNQLLTANQDYIKTNVQSLKDRGRDVKEYARLHRLGEEPKKFNELLDYEEAIIKKVEEKMRNVSHESVVKLVNKTNLNIIERVVRDGRDLQGRELEKLTELDIETLGLSQKEALVTMLSEQMSKVPRVEIEKLVSRFSVDSLVRRIGLLKNQGVVLEGLTSTESLESSLRQLKTPVIQNEPFTFANKDVFEVLIQKKVLRGMGGGHKTVPFHENQREAFKEIGERVEKEGKITKEEINIIHTKHVGFSPHAQHRLDEILDYFVEHGGLKKLEEIGEKKKQ